MSYIIRPAFVEDAEQLGQMHVQSWRETYAGIMPDDILARLSAERFAARHRDNIGKDANAHLVVEKDGKIVGFLSCEPDPDNLTQGNIHSLYLLKDAQGQGLGEKLMNLATEWLLARGCKEISLWVAVENHGAKEFYAKLGGEPKEFADQDKGKGAARQRYVWTDPKSTRLMKGKQLPAPKPKQPPQFKP